jgi:hypothetical protein
MLPGEKMRSFALLCLVTTIIEEAVLTAVLLWLLPYFGISIPFWPFVVLVLSWAAWKDRLCVPGLSFYHINLDGALQQLILSIYNAG